MPNSPRARFHRFLRAKAASAVRVHDLELVAHVAPVMLWMARPDQSRTFVNRQWLDFTGRTLDEERGFGWLAGVHPLDLANCREVWDAAFANGEEFRIEYRLRDRDGSWRWVVGHGVPRRTPSGRLIGFIGTCTDIDEIKRVDAERQRLASAIALERERLGNLISSVPGVVWEAWGEPDAASQQIDFVSDYVEEMLGYTVDEWLSTPNFWLSIVHPDDQEAAAKTAAEHWVRGGTGINTFRWLRKDGRAVWVEGHATVLQNEGGVSIGMRGVTMDITPRKRAEESLRFLSEASETLASSLELETTIKAIEQLVETKFGATCTIAIGDASTDPHAFPLVARGHHLGTLTVTRTRAFDELDRELLRLLAKRIAVAVDNAQLYRAAVDASNAKDEFLATVSHELRTPMTATLGWVRLLLRGDVEPEMHRSALEAIERSTRAQARIIDDILDVARIIMGKFQLDVVAVDLPNVIRAAIATLQPATEAKKITVDVDTEGWSGVVRGEPSRLQQVVWNVVANAIKFGKPSGRVEVKLRRDESTARLSIRDDGAGIDEHFLPHVFDRFRQAESGSKRTYGGLGLGLSIVRHLVELHGGSVRAESEGTGKGATFTIDLPIATADSALLDLNRQHVARRDVLS